MGARCCGCFNKIHKIEVIKYKNKKFFGQSVSRKIDKKKCPSNPANDVNLKWKRHFYKKYIFFNDSAKEKRTKKNQRRRLANDGGLSKFALDKREQLSEPFLSLSFSLFFFYYPDSFTSCWTADLVFFSFTFFLTKFIFSKTPPRRARYYQTRNSTPIFRGTAFDDIATHIHTFDPVDIQTRVKETTEKNTKI